MNNNEKLVVTVATSAVVTAIVSYVKTTKEERLKRVEIEAEAQRQIEAMQVANVRVQDKIRRGGFDRNLSLAAVTNDFNFEVIAARYEE